ncbi:antitoxin Xre/MbcA/ParS toxin-binding domain-containing protein [Legionella nagasakiensis]|uniref:antitoxin Xre/MbcA/ParS toxin-binding domain-containing protein n=1 Tax=Legionella nagasakiensis TaxID=535290 RepID=UPI0010551904|nr:antitoxin Xre/MbcA/ParS toxin-binding domain-containing protein [Legionella nagasakiensis]
MKTSLNKFHEKELVLTKAIVNLTHFYDLTGKDLSDLIGISPAGATRLHQGKKCISPYTKEGEMALLLLRIYRSLNSLVGNNHDKAKQWLNSQNDYFGRKPIDQMKTISGLVDVVYYLDAMRGKL